MSGFVYMMSDKPRGVIYTGVTSDLQGADMGTPQRSSERVYGTV